MLGLQASNLEQQERLFKNQIRLGLREILQQELAFYNQAFNNISSCASILAGFAFTGMMLDPYDKKSDSQPNWVKHVDSSIDVSRSIEIMFNFACAVTTCICLLTVVYSNYLGLFSTRLALRGGEMAVEESVMKVRGEYKVVLYSLTVSIVTFIVTLPILAFYKMELVDSVLVSTVSLPSGIAVLYLYRRARSLFYLDKDDRFAAAKKKHEKKNKNNNGLNDQSIGSTLSRSGGRATNAGGRLSEIVQDLDGRNDSFYVSRGRKSTMLRRSASWDATQLVNQSNPLAQPQQPTAAEMDHHNRIKSKVSIGKKFSFFNHRSKDGNSTLKTTGTNV
jgi:hypothetical protein